MESIKLMTNASTQRTQIVRFYILRNLVQHTTNDMNNRTIRIEKRAEFIFHI